MEFLTSMEFSSLVWLAIAVLEIVFRLTPSEKDNSILNKVIWLCDKLIPNKAKEGGKHLVKSVSPEKSPEAKKK